MPCRLPRSSSGTTCSLRIIAGTAKGRRLATPPKAKGRALIRPTSDRAREALFSILGPAVRGARVLDLFAGTGALGLEALSRGAAFAVFVDSQRQALELIRHNVHICGFSEQSLILKRDLPKSPLFSAELQEEMFSLVFLDPPYGKQLALGMLSALATAEGHLTPGAVVVAEEAAGEQLPPGTGDLLLTDQRRYGDTGFWFFRKMRTVR